jgi:phage FluMu gp28-like protein
VAEAAPTDSLNTGSLNTGPSPLDLLLPYQRKWVSDPARFKIGCWSRQVGKSFACAAEAVVSALTTAKTEWVILSAGERQALEFMRKVKEWAQALQFAIASDVELRDSAEAILKSAEVTWPNGSRVLALPANPDTARGYSANLILDEFAFHENPDEIWRAIYPSISNPLKGRKSIRIVSTPNGMGNKFHDLWAKPNDWSKHKVTIHDAAAQGLPINIEELRAGLDDPEGWAQEFECEFMDAAAVLLTYELIAGCESTEATTTQALEFWRTIDQSRPFYMGWDFARKRDLSVPWIGEQLGDVLHTREVAEMRGVSTPDQVEHMRLQLRVCRRVCVDYTGPGIGLGDLLVKEFGEWNPKEHKFGKVELCTFTQGMKLELFPALRVAFERQRVRIPINRVIREDLHSMQRVVGAAGGVTYRAPHTDDGHADRCTGLALCIRAASHGLGGALTDVSGIHIGQQPGAPSARIFRPRHFTPRRLA